MRIAVDAMGGDDAPRVNVDGAIAAVREFGISCLLVGRAAELENLVREAGYTGSDIEIVDAPEVVAMDDPATAAIRKKRNSSIRIAANCVRDGRAEGLVSAGHTGAAMVSAKMVVGTIEGVDRPALATVLPNLKGHCLLLDVGANPDAKTPHFREFAVMGSIYAELAFGKKSPSIGLMSIGEEDSKGTDKTKEAFKTLKETGLELHRQRRRPRRLQRHGGRDRHGRVHGQRHPQGVRGAGRDGREPAARGDQANAPGLGGLSALAVGLPALQAAPGLLGVRRGAAPGRQGLRDHLPRPLLGQGGQERHPLRRRVLAPEPRREDPGADRRAHAREERLAESLAAGGAKGPE